MRLVIAFVCLIAAFAAPRGAGLRGARARRARSLPKRSSLSRVAGAACINRPEGELAVDLWLRVREYTKR
jgi:hypothetical protein